MLGLIFDLFGYQTPEVVSGPLAYLWHILFLIVGLLMLVKGADWFVSGASSVAKKFKISAMVIGLTVVSFGTSAPELAVSLTSSIQGDPAIALGNVVGSNIMNILVVLGLSAVISPIVVKKSLIKREFPFLFAATALLIIFTMDNLFAGYTGIENLLSRGESLIFVFGIIAFCYISIVMAKKDAQIEVAQLGSIDVTVKKTEEEEIKELPVGKTILFLLIGLLCIVFGADFVTTPAKTIATSLGTEAGLNIDMVVEVVGLTVVAVGTSLPELVTSVIASKKGENEIAIGNVVGSNIFNILFICGLCGLVLPLSMEPSIITDMVISLFITLIVFLYCKKLELTKKNGWILTTLYFVYLAYILVRLFLDKEGISISIPF